MVSSQQLSVGPEAKPPDLFGAPCSHSEFLEDTKIPLQHEFTINTCLLFIFNTYIYTFIFQQWDLFQYVYYKTLVQGSAKEPRDCTGLLLKGALPLSPTTICGFSCYWKQPLALWCLRPITFLFDLTNRCSQTLFFFMGCLPSGFQQTDFLKRLLRGTGK